jgi:hypothetical protein
MQAVPHASSATVLPCKHVCMVAVHTPEGRIHEHSNVTCVSRPYRRGSPVQLTSIEHHSDTQQPTHSTEARGRAGHPAHLTSLSLSMLPWLACPPWPGPHGTAEASPASRNPSQARRRKLLGSEAGGSAASELNILGRVDARCSGGPPKHRLRPSCSPAAGPLPARRRHCRLPPRPPCLGGPTWPGGGQPGTNWGAAAGGPAPVWGNVSLALVPCTAMPAPVWYGSRSPKLPPWVPCLPLLPLPIAAPPSTPWRERSA